MPLDFIEIKATDSNRRVVHFVTSDGSRQIPCRVSYEAMDDEERNRNQLTDEERIEQFTRLRGRIVEAAARLYFAPGVKQEEVDVILVKRENLSAVPKGL